MKTKVIIIDDHSLFNDGLSLILKESGYFDVIEQVYDSRQAYYKCFALMPELIIVDFNMPHLNGLEVVKQLKNLSNPCKIVVISMYADKREIALFEEVGIDGYLTKTTPATEIIGSLKKILEGEKLINTGIEKKVIYEKDFFALKHQLTKREVEILKALKKGYTTEQVAEELGLSFYTVETHRKNVNQKLKFKTKKEFYDFLESIEVDK
ncbi:MAG: response regulator transcription factor [Bacteroidota bacterium]|jgi:DNA-binding NarL/FixJ family response regulator